MTSLYDGIDDAWARVCRQMDADPTNILAKAMFISGAIYALKYDECGIPGPPIAEDE